MDNDEQPADAAHNSPGNGDASASDKAPDAPPKYMRRQSAARYIRERWGLPCQATWLAKLAVVGGGPLFRRSGRFPVYTKQDLDAWAQSRLSGPLRSTSDTC